MKDLLWQARVIVRTSNAKFLVVVWQTARRRIEQKGMPHVQHGYFSSFNQWYRSFSLWRYRSRWHRHFLNSQLYDIAKIWFRRNSGLKVTLMSRFARSCKNCNFSQKWWVSKYCLTWLCWLVRYSSSTNLITSIRSNTNCLKVSGYLLQTLYYKLLEKTQLLLSPEESVTSYLMFVFPTLKRSGGRKPRKFKVWLELSVGTGPFQKVVA